MLLLLRLTICLVPDKHHTRMKDKKMNPIVHQSIVDNVIKLQNKPTDHTVSHNAVPVCRKLYQNTNSQTDSVLYNIPICQPG